MLIVEGRKKEIKKALKQAFNQGLRDGRPEIATKAPPESSAPTAPGSPERDAQVNQAVARSSRHGRTRIRHSRKEDRMQLIRLPRNSPNHQNHN